MMIANELRTRSDGLQHVSTNKEKGDIMKKYFATLYRKLVDYLNDSSALTTGSHRGEPHCCGMYSGLSDMEQGHEKN